MEILSDVLRAVRLTGALFFEVEMTSPWVAETPSTAEIAGSVMPEAGHVICFHAILSGCCWAMVEDDASSELWMEAGDVILLPAGRRHAMASARGMRAEPDMALYHRPADRPLPFALRWGGGGTERAHFVCGYLGCDAKPFNPLLDALPPSSSPAAWRTARGWIGQLIRVGLGETGLGAPGARSSSPGSANCCSSRCSGATSIRCRRSLRAGWRGCATGTSARRSAWSTPARPRTGRW